MNLKEFRDQFPGFRPHAPCEDRDGHQLEVISWPWKEDEDAEVFINARIPHDPTTMQTYCISGDDPSLFTLEGFCERHHKHFVPIMVESGLTGCPECGPGVHKYLLQRLKLIHASQLER